MYELVVKKKVCSKCHKRKPESQFHLQREGRMCWCKKCHRDWVYGRRKAFRQIRKERTEQ